MSTCVAFSHIRQKRFRQHCQTVPRPHDASFHESRGPFRVGGRGQSHLFEVQIPSLYNSFTNNNNNHFSQCFAGRRGETTSSKKQGRRQAESERRQVESESESESEGDAQTQSGRGFEKEACSSNGRRPDHVLRSSQSFAPCLAFVLQVRLVCPRQTRFLALTQRNQCPPRSRA